MSKQVCIVTRVAPVKTGNAKIPTIIRNYFIAQHETRGDLAEIAQVYVPNSGWVTLDNARRVSVNALREYKRLGATYVAVRVGRFTADFKIKECI